MKTALLQMVQNLAPQSGAAKITLVVFTIAVAIVAGLATVIFLNGFRQRAGARSITKRACVALPLLIVCLLMIMTSCSSNSAADRGIHAADKNQSAVGTLNGSDYAEGAFEGDIDDAELQAWLNKHFQREVTLQELRASYAGKTHPSQEQNRIVAARQAMQKYLDVNSKGLDGPVLFPMNELLAAYYGDDWSNKSAEERLKAINKALLEWSQDCIGHPELMDELLQLYQDFPIIIERNQSWLPQFIKKFNDSYLRTEEPIGNASWFEPQKTANDPLLLTEDYVINAAKAIRLFFENFELIEDPIQSWQTYKNWYLPHNDNADLNRTEPNPQQIKIPSIILVDKYQEPGEGITVGICMFDQRLEEYKTIEKPAPAAPESPATPQEPGTPSTPDNPTPPTPTPPTPDNPTPPTPEKPNPPTTNPGKDKTEDPINSGNSKPNGIVNKPGSGQGEVQETKPPQDLVPEENSPQNPANTPNTSVGSDERQQAPTGTTSATDNKGTSSGHGGSDSNIVDGNGGKTHGTTPDKKPTEIKNDTTVTVTKPSNSGSGGSGGTSSTTTTTNTSSDRDNPSSDKVSRPE